MSSFHDYESFGTLNFRQASPSLYESFSGVSIVDWYGRIERQIQNMVEDAVKGRNKPYEDRLRNFLKIWRDNEIDGSLNREPIDILAATCDTLAVDSTWTCSNFFSVLRDRLRAIVASEEQLPRDVDMNANDPLRGGGGAGGAGAPPVLNPDFGPTQDGPPGPGDEAPEDEGKDMGPLPTGEEPLPGEEEPGTEPKPKL